jgi:two-component system, cell cycle response regulator
MTTIQPSFTLPHEILHADSLPSLPAVALEVLRLTAEEGTTLDDLADAISRDPALSAKLLKLSNSSLFSMGHEVSTLQKATMVLGMKSVMLMALSFSLAETIPKKVNGGPFDYSDYWHRSLVGAVAGRQLATHAGHPELADEAFLCGLLASFGGLVMAECLPVDYSEVLTMSDGNWPTTEIEDQYMGFNQSDIIMALLDSWSIPPLLSKSVGYMQRPQKLPRGLTEEIRNLTAIMTLTALTTRVICDRDKGRHLRLLQKWGGAKYSMTREVLNTFLHGLESGIKETASMLQVDLPNSRHEDILKVAREHLLALSLGNTHMLQTTEQTNKSLEMEKLVLHERATTDALSGLPNRAALDERLRVEIESRLNRKKPLLLGVIMIDIDHFKIFNDTKGHAAGDEVIRCVGAALADVLRPEDFGARYGGEEFTVIMPLTTRESALAVAERIRSRIEYLECDFNGEVLKVTVSLGCATLECAQSNLDGERLIAAADAKLYQAKESGRNQVAH